MRWLLVALLALHGLIHFMGPAKALGLAELPQLTQPVSRVAAFGWAAAGLAMLAAGVALAAGSRAWWLLGLVAVALSQAMILTAWGDAKAGTVANVIVLAGVVYGFASEGPLSFRAAYRREVRERVGALEARRPVTEADLASLPEPVRRYLRSSGAVGQPRVHHFRAAWRGRIRGSPDEPWMAFTAVQHDFVDEPARFFLMHAKRGGLPVHVYHAYHAPDVASMRVRLLGLLPMVDEHGPEMRQAETVTVLNDFSLFAPAALLDPRIRWEAVGTNQARAHFTVREHTITAELVFNEAGELVDWVSDDRLAASDGGDLQRRRWSTPVADYRAFGPFRLASRGVGRWHTADGTWTYIELELVEHEINGPGIE